MDDEMRKKRLELYDRAPEQVQALYSDPSSGEILRNMARQYQIKDADYGRFALLVGDVMLGIYTKEEMLRKLPAAFVIPTNILLGLKTSLLDFLRDIDDVQIAASRPQPLRTMEEDMQKVHGYGAFRKQFPREEESDAIPTYSSSQDQVVNRPKLADAPSYTPDVSSSTQNP